MTIIPCLDYTTSPTQCSLQINGGYQQQAPTAMALQQLVFHYTQPAVFPKGKGATSHPRYTLFGRLQ